MKKHLFILGFAMLLSVAGAFAQVEVNGIYYNLLSESEAEVTAHPSSGYSGDIVIPSVISYDEEDYIVTTIGNYAFYPCPALTSVTIPNSVTGIYTSNFFDCPALTSITVESGNPNYSSDDGVLLNQDQTAVFRCPEGKAGSYVMANSATRIYNSAFWGCSALSSVTMPNSVTTIGGYAFSHCSALTSITLSNSITTIEERTFYGCSALASVIIPNSVDTIGDLAFYGCSALTSIILGNSVATLVKSAFAGCTALTSIEVESENANYSSVDGVLSNKSKTTLLLCPQGKTSYTVPNSVTTIGEGAFSYCIKLTSIDISNSVTAIGSSAFSDCTALTSIDIPNSVTTIGSKAFSGCIALASIDIPNGVSAIEKETFAGCSALASVTIPSSVKSIGEEYAFINCVALTSITVLNLVPIKISPTVFNLYFWDPTVDITAITLEVPTSAVPDYQAAEVWKEMIIVGGGMLVNPVPGDPKQGYTESDGLYNGRATTTVTAVPRNNYKFVSWTKDGVEVSRDNPYSFTVTEDVELVANFLTSTVISPLPLFQCLPVSDLPAFLEVVAL